MNERINGLWWKARIGYNNQSCDPEVLEKFAELILQDVMSICEDLGDKGLDGHYCVDKIRKEFGV
jgi:hypothetical protein